jgi:YfiH family protein
MNSQALGFIPAWPAPPRVRAFSSFRNGGVSVAPYASLNLGSHVGDAPAAVSENRDRLRLAADLPSEPAWLNQVHGINVVNLDAVPTVPPADAAYTRQAGRVCTILTADCLPVLFCDDAGDIAAAAHAGWRGLAAGVLEATINAMGANARGLLAYLGAAIGPAHFEVGAEVRAEFLRHDAAAALAFSVNQRGRFMADLRILARQRLAAAGVSRVYGTAACTYADSARYFSYRREQNTGRQATLIWLEN